MSRYAAVVLAAGQGTRYRASGGTEPSKLVAPLAGEPLIRHAVSAVIGSRAKPVVVVTGHEAGLIQAALADCDVETRHNPDYASGLAGSLKTGLAALPQDVDGAIIVLGDMPGITSALIDRLIDAADGTPLAAAVVPVRAGRRGNPVYLSSSLFPAVARLTGDEGARRLLSDPGVRICELALDDDAVSADVDLATDLAFFGPSPRLDARR